ncbi:unnamed protein product [Penicillium olsonii]|uniref:Uncharacterized protein n=1 Tax=Penicillium olsonii TaxID=99116 RepID=A0A9W4HGK5_PENOL|nr:unnamed protein product [Penicillium olsonii]
MDALLSQLDALVLKPELAPLLSLVKGARNGIVYGSKVRFPHALVIREKTKLVFKATRQHARNLSTFAIIWKASMILLRNVPGGTGKEGRYDSFFAGLLGGYAVFGRQPGSISQQIVIYVFARVMLALAKLAIQPNMHPLSSLITPEAREKMTNNAYPVFASMTWAMVMYIWRWYPETLASSLRSSMVYMYVSLAWTEDDLADLDLVMATRIIGIPCARSCCITNEVVLLWVSAYRAGCSVFLRVNMHHSRPSSLVFRLPCMMRHGTSSYLLFITIYRGVYITLRIPTPYLVSGSPGQIPEMFTFNGQATHKYREPHPGSFSHKNT